MRTNTSRCYLRAWIIFVFVFVLFTTSGMSGQAFPDLFQAPDRGSKTKVYNRADALFYSNNASPDYFGGETITVTTLNDVSDFSAPQQVGDLPGPDGRISFREACTAANNTPGPQTIAFAIPIAEFWLDPTTALLKLEENAFFIRDSGTTIDFSTQTTNIGDTNPNGPEVGIYGLQPNGWGIAAILVTGDNNIIKGLGKVYQRGYGVEFVGDNNRIISSQINGPLHAAVNIEGSGLTIAAGNVIGGTEPGEGNTLSGLTIRGPADDSIVIGNIIIGGIDVQGATRYGVITRNNRIGGLSPAERNVIAGAGYYGEEGYPVGAQVRIVDADDTIVQGNYVGTTPDGMARYPLQIGPVGVEIYDARGTIVRGNLIAGLRTVGTNHYDGQIFGQAIHVGATNENTRDTAIEENTIGVAADGITPIVTRSGIVVTPLSGLHHALGTRIGSNHIASVETTGIVIGSQEQGVTITGNSIHDSGGLGIDLFSGNFTGVGGVTPNDPGDVDEGGNSLQNFPVLQSAETNGSTVAIQGTLDSTPSAQFTVEFFASPSCDPSGFGEGAVFLGARLVTTDGAGLGTFSATLPATIGVGAKATATATRMSTGDTSEFSACVAVTLASGPTPTPTATPTPTPEPTPTPTSTSRTPFDYDGDGLTDISVFRPETGVWYLDRSREGFHAVQFGISSDKITPADYDGDGKTDISVFRPATGVWHFTNSATNTYTAESFGISTDIPVPGDFDGDGKTDMAVYRPSDGNWWIKRSSAGLIVQRFGIGEDRPAVGDYDGDGKSDIALYRPSTGVWYLLRSNLGFYATQFGLSTDSITPADFDGDGKTDIAVYRASEGIWYRINTTTGSFIAERFGTPADIPTPGDYDGDGMTDTAIYRPSDGCWWINRSSAGLIVKWFGVEADKPTPAAFIY